MSPRLSPFHLIRAPVTVLTGVPYTGAGTIADIEHAAAKAVNLLNGAEISDCFGFGRPAYGGKSNSGTRSQWRACAAVAQASPLSGGTPSSRRPLSTRPPRVPLPSPVSAQCRGTQANKRTVEFTCPSKVPEN